MKFSTAIALLVLSSAASQAAAFHVSSPTSINTVLAASRSRVGIPEPGVRTAAPSRGVGIEAPRPRAPPMVTTIPRSERDAANQQKPARPNKIQTVQGGSLKTWSFQSPSVERVQVQLKTDGRPMDAEIELWKGPDNTPQRMRVYLEDGLKRPFTTLIETPRGPNTVAVRNIGTLEFPLSAFVTADNQAEPELERFNTIQGGSIRTYPFGPLVESIQVQIRTDGRPLNARIELLQGPNTNKEVIELYTEDGLDRPFYAIIETPEARGTVVRLVNTAPIEFPLSAAVEPFMISTFADAPLEPVLGGDEQAAFMSKIDQW